MCRQFARLLSLALLTGLAASAQGADWIYTVVDGDNLWDLSERYLDSPARFDQVRRLNNVEFPKRLQPGTRLRIPMQWIRSNPVPARLDAIQGEVQTIRANGHVEQAVPGTLLQLGDTLKTGVESSAAILFGDGSVVTLHGSSEMRFDHLSAHGETGMVDSRLHLLDGRLDTRVKPAAGPGSRFEIQTPAAISAVRGTEYRAAVTEAGEISKIEVLEGKVQVKGARRPRLINAGFGTRVAVGEAPLPPRRLLPAPTLEPLPPRIRELNWPLRWQPLDGAQGYRTEIAADAKFTVLAWEQVSERARVPLPDLPDADYWVRVRGIDALGLEGNSRAQGLTIDTRPQPPVLLQPNDGRVLRGASAELQWTASADAANYRLEVATDAAFGNIVLARDDLATTQFAANELDRPATYHWRVSSIAEDGELGPPSAARSWQIKPAPEAIDASLAVKDDGLVASWRAGPMQHRYQVQVAYDPDFRDLELDRTIDQPRLALQPLSGQVRYLRVRAIETDGYQGPWGAVQRIDPPPDPTRWLVPLLGVLGILIL